MDTEKVIEFLEKVATQLGPAGEQAFRIVAARVYIESLVLTILGIVMLVVSMGLLGLSVRQYKKNTYNSENLGISIAVLTFFFFASGLLLFLFNIFNLFSIEYATIERILNLVSGGRN